MKVSSKRWAAASAVMLLAAVMCVPAYASDKKVSTVKITLTGEEPLAGESVGSVAASVNDTYFKVEDCSYTNEDDDEWERGTTPIVRVELIITNDDYYFGSMSKSNINISGMHGEYKSSKVLDGGNGLRVDIKLRKVAGDLSEVDDYYWEGKTAVWEEVDDADKYEVKLYRGTRTVTTVTTTNHSYNFYPHMTSAGDYTFKVRAVSNSDNEKSSWTESSDDLEIRSSQVYTGAAPGTGDTGNTGVGGPGGSGSPNGGTINSAGGQWFDSPYGWWYRLANGNPVKNSWLYVDNNWFRFDVNGFMMTGVQAIDGKIYYLNPVSDGTRGAMLTGVQIINGGFYYFSPTSDGTRGIMLTGLQAINGNWYYFDTASGVMWANATAPNGRWIDGAGVVH